MKLTEGLLERKFPARDKSRLAARRAITRSDDHDSDSSTSTSPEVAAATSTGREQNSLISSSKCASSEILCTRFVRIARIFNTYGPSMCHR